MKQIGVGDEMDSYCGVCKLTLAHSIVAMDGKKAVKLRCLTCSAEHKPRKQPRTTTTTKKKKTPSRASSKPSAWQLEMEKWSDLSAVSYSIYQTYGVDYFILHKTFGKGVVLNVPSPEKIIALFEGGEKMLLQGRKKR